MVEASQKLLDVKGLRKEYPGAVALAGVDLDVFAGEVHCLVGQNGAGKSTLIKCISGSIAPTAGEIEFDGQALPVGKPSASLALGVATMYQELDLVDDLSVAENIFLGHEKRVGPFVDRRAMNAETRQLMKRLGHASLDPSAKVGSLRPAYKQLVSMARALSRDVKLLIMDEPSAILDPPEVDALFEVVKRLTAEGVGVIYISHRLEEIARIGDRVTVLRDGSTVASDLPADTAIDELISNMVGRSFDEVFPDRVPHGDDVVLQVQNLSGKTAVFDASFELRRGEILGIGGLVGAGRTELLRLVFGLDRRTSGEVRVNGELLTGGRPDLAIELGLGMAPEERKSQGLWLGWSQVRNVDISDMRRVGSKYLKGLFTSDRQERRATTPPLESLATRPADPSRLAGELSGGNQQKVVLARWLLHSTKVLLLDEPTRGVDVGAKADVYKVINDLAKSGMSILVVSSELAELVGFCDRVLVMREGRLVADLENRSATEQEILRYALGAAQ